MKVIRVANNTPIKANNNESLVVVLVVNERESNILKGVIDDHKYIFFGNYYEFFIDKLAKDLGYITEEDSPYYEDHPILKITSTALDLILIDEHLDNFPLKIIKYGEAKFLLPVNQYIVSELLIALKLKIHDKYNDPFIQTIYDELCSALTVDELITYQAQIKVDQYNKVKPDQYMFNI